MSGSQGRSRHKKLSSPSFASNIPGIWITIFWGLFKEVKMILLLVFYPSSIVRYCTCLKTSFLQYNTSIFLSSWNFIKFNVIHSSLTFVSNFKLRREIHEIVYDQMRLNIFFFNVQLESSPNLTLKLFHRHDSAIHYYLVIHCKSLSPVIRPIDGLSACRDSKHDLI